MTGTGVILRTSANPSNGYTIYEATAVTGAGQIGIDTGALITGHITRHVVTAVNEATTAPAGTDVISIGTETTSSEGYTLYRTTYLDITNADLPDEITNRYGGELVLTTKRSINTATSGTGVVLRSSSNPSNGGYTIYETTYVTGAGQIGTDTGNVIAGHITRHVVSSVNEVPTTPAGTDVFPVGTETTQADGHTLYRTTYLDITDADLAPEISYKLNGKLVVTTLKSINQVPDGTGYGFKISSSSAPSNGYTIYEATFVTSDVGEPVEVDNETTYSLNSRLITIKKRWINGTPPDPSGDYVNLISSKVSDADGYTLHEYVWVSGRGIIDTTTDPRSDGSSVYTVTSLNELPDDAGEPEGSYLLSTDSAPGEGYIIYTQQYYTKPDDYTVEGVQVVVVPGLMSVNTTGPYPERLPQITAVTTSIEVKFTNSPSAGSIVPIRGGGVVYENATFTDGTDPLHKNTVFGKDYYAGSSNSGIGGTYRDHPVTSYNCPVYGAVDQTGSTITFNYDAVPFFRTPTLTIYKETRETGTL